VAGIVGVSWKDPKTGVNVTFQSDKGEFGFSTKGNWMALQWATLCEVTPAGENLQCVDLSDHHYGWSEPEFGFVYNLQGQQTEERLPKVSYNHSLNNGAWFNISAWIVDNDSQTGKRKRDWVKFSFNISDWPWKSIPGGNAETENPEGLLVLTAGLVGFGGIVRSTDNKAANGPGAVAAVDLGSGFLASPLEAWYDDLEIRPVVVEHSLKGKPIATWTFSRFSRSVYYDPVIGMGNYIPQPAEMSVFERESKWLIPLIVIIGILIIAIPAVVFYKKREPTGAYTKDVDMQEVRSDSTQATETPTETAT
jgi:hypothetical protein